jgi:predicted dehydrogenase
MLPGIWRWWYDYGVGDIGNDGVHDIDVACWGLGEAAAMLKRKYRPGHWAVPKGV